MTGPFVTAGAPLSPALARALAGELRLASRTLANLAGDLGSDGAVVRRHMTGLQAVDRINQVHAIVADFLCGEATLDDLLDAVPLAAMAERLRCACRGTDEATHDAPSG